MDGTDRNNGIEARLTALEQDMARLDTLVDGHAPWSHRSRLHALKDAQRSVIVAEQALKAYKSTRFSLRSQVREWGAFVLAAVAIARSMGWL